SISRTPFEAQTMSEPTAADAPKSRKFRILRTLGICAILLVVLIAAAPWIVAHTGLRDTAINAILASPTVTASSDSASFGSSSPLAVHGWRLKSASSHIDVQVEEIASERTPWQLWSSSPELGTIRVKKPHVHVLLPLDVKLERDKQLLEP